MKKGAVLTSDSLTTKKPGTGISPDRLNDVIGRRLARDVKLEKLLQWDDIEENEKISR